MSDQRTTDEISDEAHARRAQNGGMASFDVLVRRYQSPLLHFITKRTGCRADAEDLVQETFVRCYRHLDRFDPARRFHTWIFTIAYRLTVNHHRQTRRLHRIEQVDAAGDLPAAGRSPVDEVADRELAGRLWQQAEALLNDVQLTVLWLHCVEQMPLTEVARVMKRSGVSVRATLFRARKKLSRLAESAEPVAVASVARGTSLRSPTGSIHVTQQATT